jgi:hypothetical protein
MENVSIDIDLKWEEILEVIRMCLLKYSMERTWNNVAEVK